MSIDWKDEQKSVQVRVHRSAFIITNPLLFTHRIIERELSHDPVPALLKLLVQSHQIERVQAIDNRGPEIVDPEHAARVTPLAQRSQLVFAPGVQLVVVPRVQHHLDEKLKKNIRDRSVEFSHKTMWIMV